MAFNWNDSFGNQQGYEGQQKDQTRAGNEKQMLYERDALERERAMQQFKQDFELMRKTKEYESANTRERAALEAQLFAMRNGFLPKEMSQALAMGEKFDLRAKQRQQNAQQIKSLAEAQPEKNTVLENAFGVLSAPARYSTSKLKPTGARGAMAGAAFGGVAGGPVGAVAGGVAGAGLGWLAGTALGALTGEEDENKWY